MGPTATLVRTIEWWDTDASGHHHNSTIMRLVEATEAKLMKARGIRDYYFGAAPRVRQEIDFEAILHFGQVATTTVTIEKIGRTSLVLAFEIWAEEFDGRPRTRAAKGHLFTAHVPRGSKESHPWPEHVIAALTSSIGSSQDRVGVGGSDDRG